MLRRQAWRRCAATSAGAAPGAAASRPSSDDGSSPSSAADINTGDGLDPPTAPRTRATGGPIYRFNEWLRSLYWDKLRGHEVPAKEGEEAFAGIPNPFAPGGKMDFGWRFQYFSVWSNFHVPDFIDADQDRVSTYAHTFRHPVTGVRVTLLPVLHVGHPAFWRQVDELCSQHQSVLMEGRYANTSAPTTCIPPRQMSTEIRPIEHYDAEGWEPNEMEKFFQPYSWGVAHSANHTVIHAGDKYDYEKLPVWASLRYNTPLIGGWAREKHCLSLIPTLHENGYNTFVIPWGAYHMPIMATMLRKNGFEFVGSCRLVVFDRVDGMVSGGYVKQFRTTLRAYSWWYNIVIVLATWFPLVALYTFMACDGSLLSYRERPADYDELDSVQTWAFRSRTPW